MTDPQHLQNSYSDQILLLMNDPLYNPPPVIFIL